MKYILWPIVIVLIIGWVLGFIVFEILGGLIHLLLVVAVVLIVYNWFKGKTKTA